MGVGLKFCPFTEVLHLLLSGAPGSLLFWEHFFFFNEIFKHVQE